MKNFIKNLLVKNHFWWLFWAVFLLAIIFAGYGGYLTHLKNYSSQKSEFNSELLNEPIEAMAYLVGNINNNKILLSHNEEMHFFPASLSKLITAEIVIDNIPLEQEIKISNYAISAEGEEGNLKAGEILTAKDLLKILLISSSNDAALALAENIRGGEKTFVDLMNAKAKQLGLFSTAFFGPTGVDRKGNFTTAKDLFLLAQDIYQHYPLIGEITRKMQETVVSSDGQIIHSLTNTNILIEKLPDLWLGKTGSTPDARDCLLTIFEFPFKDDKISIAIIVLNSNDRFGDTIKLYNWVRYNLAINQ